MESVIRCHTSSQLLLERSSCSVMVKVPDCILEVSEFKFPSHCFNAHFLTNSRKVCTLHRYEKWYHYFFYKNGFGIKYSTKVGMALYKEIKPINSFINKQKKITVLGRYNSWSWSSLRIQSCCSPRMVVTQPFCFSNKVMSKFMSFTIGLERKERKQPQTDLNSARRYHF